MEKIFKIFGSLIIIIAGFKILIVQKFYARGGEIDFSSPLAYWPIGLFFILVGLYWLYEIFIKKNYDID